MEIISIKNLRTIYENYKSEEARYKNQNHLKFNYLNLSIHFSRDEREFDKSNYKILLNLTSKRKNQKKFYNGKEKIDFFWKYLFSFKEFNYLPKRKLFHTISIDIFKFGKQIIDIFGVFIIFLLNIVYRFLRYQNNKKLILKNQKIYSIYYWNKKNLNLLLTIILL